MTKSIDFLENREISKEGQEFDSFVNHKWFGVVTIVLGLFGLLIMLHKIFSWQACLYPLLDSVYPSCTTNNVSGANFLSFFTTQSNVLVDIFLIIFGLGNLGIKPLKNFSRNRKIVGSVFLYIFITGIIYCGLLIWFQVDYPWDTPLWMNNVACYYEHMFIPVFMTVLWFFPSKRVFINSKTSFYWLIYPLAYFIFSVVRGANMPEHFYPYPFLNAKQIWMYIGGGSAYNALLANIVLIVFVVAFIALFYFAGLLLIKINNKVSLNKKIKLAQVGLEKTKKEMQPVFGEDTQIQ